MNKILTLGVICAAIVGGIGIGVTANRVLAGDDAKKGAEAKGAETTGEDMAKLCAPGENHKMLENSVGEFEFTSKMWMDPSAEPLVSKGTSSRKMIYGGRFLQETITTTECEMCALSGTALPYVSQNTVGYNNFTKKYQSCYFSSVCTQMVTATGTYDEAAKACTLTCNMFCPVEGKEIPARMVIQHKDKDTEIFSLYLTSTGKPEAKLMEINYTRKK